jgi:hypothetical protein
MWRKWANRIVLVAVAGSVLLAASSGLNQPQALASAGDNTNRGITLPPNQGPIGAQAAPAVSIAAPSSTIGDFGANNGNVWDMNSTADIVWRQSDASGHKIALSQTEAGIVHGVTPQGSDLAIAFYGSSSTNLPSSQYHNLIYRLKIAAGPQPTKCATNGRVIYTKVWPPTASNTHTNAYSPELAPMYCAYGEYCLYYIDLSSNDNGSIKNTWPSSPPPWPTDSVKGFGMWPHEVWYSTNGGSCNQTGPSSFDLDFVYLTGDIVARAEDSPAYQYTVKYNATDPDGGTGTADFYYQMLDELQLPSASPTCNSSTLGAWTHFGQQSITFGGTPSYPRKTYLPVIVGGGGSGGTGQYNQTYTWDLSSGSYQNGKSYYLCIKVTDSSSLSSYAASSAPVIRVPRSPWFAPPR